ncbi:short chain dehydrogenase [Xylaria bambusicola]|uniref:short chain dehydrogenase n=1 Tax=Xylaria bambusicola TaxID=326684 RepID=UPI002008CF83|nr:short chain dehydrogenase [Xylaria bambusicola]KAI0528047.1 short chain dehydrogenase [Xylaria bambusicola]
MDNIFRVDGMVAVVTGGGTGIGFNMAKALANAGAKKVYILGRRREVLEKAAKAHESLYPIVCDVGSKESLQAAVDAITKESSYVNLVVANSGIIGPAARFHPDSSIKDLKQRLFDDVSMDDFSQTMNINVTGAYFTMLAFLELLDAGNENARKGGFGAPLSAGSSTVPSIQSQVLFTSSISAYSRAWISPPSYSASKAAIEHLAKHASTNLAPYGIRVNAMAPGLFPSELAFLNIQERDPSKEHPSELRYIPAQRFGGEEEMAGTVLYLASRAGAYCNGLVLVNDGGKLSTMPNSY